MTKRKKSNTKITAKKLGRYRIGGKYLYGFALIGKNHIFIDSRLKGKAYLDILIHEKLHLMFPDWSEAKVLRTARELARFLWNHSYRKIDNHKEMPN